MANTPIDKKLLITEISQLFEEKFYCSVSGKEIKDYAYWSPDTFRIYSSKGNLKRGLNQYKETHQGMNLSVNEMEKQALMYSKADLKKNKIMIINKNNSYKPKEYQ